MLGFGWIVWQELRRRRRGAVLATETGAQLWQVDLAAEGDHLEVAGPWAKSACRTPFSASSGLCPKRSAGLARLMPASGAFVSHRRQPARGARVGDKGRGQRRAGGRFADRRTDRRRPLRRPVRSQLNKRAQGDCPFSVGCCAHAKVGLSPLRRRADCPSYSAAVALNPVFAHGTV